MRTLKTGHANSIVFEPSKVNSFYITVWRKVVFYSEFFMVILGLDRKRDWQALPTLNNRAMRSFGSNSGEEERTMVTE